MKITTIHDPFVTCKFYATFSQVIRLTKWGIAAIQQLIN